MHPGSATGTLPQALAACAQSLPLWLLTSRQRTQLLPRLSPSTLVGRHFRLDRSHHLAAPAVPEANLVLDVPSAHPALLPQRSSWQMPRATDCANWPDAKQPARPPLRPLSPTGLSATMSSHMAVNQLPCLTFLCHGMSASLLLTRWRPNSHASSRLISASGDL